MVRGRECEGVCRAAVGKRRCGEGKRVEAVGRADGKKCEAASRGRGGVVAHLRLFIIQDFNSKITEMINS